MVFVFVIRIRAKMWTQIIFVFCFPNTYLHIVICSGNFDCITWGIFCITCVHCLELGWVALHWSCSGPVAWEEKCGLGGKMWPGRSENVKKFSLNLSWCIIAARAPARASNLTNGWLSSIARIKVVPDLGCPPASVFSIWPACCQGTS